MTTITFTCALPEEQSEADIYYNAPNVVAAVFDLLDDLRNEYKYREDSSKKKRYTAEQISDMIRRAMEERDVNLEVLTR